MTSTLARPAVTGRRWNTLRILKASRTALLALSVLLLIAIVTGTGVHRGAMRTVGKDAAPSIIAAQHIKAALADMDAEAVNGLLALPGKNSAPAAYNARRIEAAKALVTAAENITYGESEREPIQTLEVGLGTYEQRMQRAQDLHAEGNAGAVEAYREAAAVMDGTLLPAADALDGANHAVLEQVYRSQSARSAGARAAVVFAGLLLVLALAFAQLYLTRRTRRLLNPYLLAAMLLTLGLTAHTWRAMASEAEEIKVAKEDAFTSIHALWRARAVAYEANGDESRFLADPARAESAQRAFLAKAEALAKPPGGLTPDQLLAAARNGGPVDGFTGYLADELRNITFPGEREAALKTLASLEAYLKLDEQMRALERKGAHRQAVDLCLGTAPGQSDWAFGQFDEALEATLAINQSEFELAVAKGLGVLNGLEGQAVLLVLVIAVLMILGYSARIREYQ